MYCMNVEFARYAVMFSHAFSDFVDVCCHKRSGILLRGPDCKKPDRLAANQSARFARILDRKKINTVIVQVVKYLPLHQLLLSIGLHCINQDVGLGLLTHFLDANSKYLQQKSYLLCMTSYVPNITRKALWQG